MRRSIGTGIGLLLAAWAPARAQVDTLASSPAEYTLEQCIRFALSHSPELHEAELGLDVANKQVQEAWGEILPTLDATVQYTRNVTDQQSFIPAILFDPNADPSQLIEVTFAGQNIWNTRFILEQPLFQAEAFVGLGAAGRFRALETERVRGVSHQIALEIRRQYYAALLAMANERLTQASIDRVQDTLDGAIVLERAGLGNNYDILRLQVELARLQPNLRRAETDRTEAERRLKIAMGLDLTEPLALPGELGMIDLDRPDANTPAARDLLRMAGVQVGDSSQVPELVVLALENRSDARQARLDTELWRAQHRAARATLYPKLFGFANYTIDAQENGSPDFFGENSSQRVTNWQAGLRLEVPLFEGGQKFARMAQRSLQVQQSLTRERLIEQQVTGTVETLVERLLEARARARAQALALQQAQRGFDIALTEFEQGLNTQLNALDAEVALRETQFNYAEAIHDVFRSQADLDAAVGVVPVIDVREEAP